MREGDREEERQKESEKGREQRGRKRGGGSVFYLSEGERERAIEKVKKEGE